MGVANVVRVNIVYDASHILTGLAIGGGCIARSARLVAWGADESGTLFVLASRAGSCACVEVDSFVVIGGSGRVDLALGAVSESSSIACFAPIGALGACAVREVGVVAAWTIGDTTTVDIVVIERRCTAINSNTVMSGSITGSAL